MYEWVRSLAAKPWAMYALAVLAFAESSFFPIPPDLLLIPLVLGALDWKNRRSAPWWMFALVCTVASVLGGVFGYAIGALFMPTLGQSLVAFLGYQDQLATLTQQYQDNAIMVVFLASFTPLPYKIFTLTSGALAMPLGQFVVISVLGRGLRFFAVAAIVRFLGAAAEPFIRKHFTWLSIVAGVAFVAAYVWLKVL